MRKLHQMRKLCKTSGGEPLTQIISTNYFQTIFDSISHPSVSGADAIKKFTSSLGIPYLGV